MSATPSMDEMVAAVRKHATENYERDGWDFLVECWEDKDIVEELRKARVRSINGAIRVIRSCVTVTNDHRTEIEATAF